VSVELDPRALFAVLDAHRVDYVLIGGLGAVLHGSSLTTLDADLLPDMAQENLVRLAAALRDLDARLRVAGEPDGIPFDPHPALIRSMRCLTMRTRVGDVDLTIEPAALGDYEAVNSTSIGVLVDGVEVRVAALDDIIRSKEAAGRPKDALGLPYLYALRDEIAKARDPEV
jgi:hypothetical protein